MAGYLTPNASRGRLVALRVAAPLALPAPAGHVPQLLPGMQRARQRSLLPVVWTSLGAGIIGFLVATGLVSTGGTDTGGVVGRLSLGPEGATPAAESRLRGLGEALARLVIAPPAAPPVSRSTLPPDVRAPSDIEPSAGDDTVTSLGALAETLNAPTLDVGPLGEPLPGGSAPLATWSGLVVGAISDPAERGGATPIPAMDLGATRAGDALDTTVEEEEDEATPALAGAPRPPPAAPPRSRTASAAAAPRLPRITHSQPGAGARGANNPGSVSIPLPPLPEPRQVAVMRPVPPPDGYITQTTAAPAARQAAGGATWMKFARAFDPNDGRPRIALVVTDLGLAAALTDQAINYLPGPVTLAFNPFAENLPRWVEQARRAGHEVLINLPLEASGTQPRDAGSSPASAPVTADESLGRLDWALARASGYVGVASFMGAGVNGGEDVLRPVLTTLRDRGFIYVDRQTGPRATALRLASELGVPRAVADRQLDAEPTREAIEARLGEIERQARESGFAVALVRPHSISFERLAIWQTTLDAKGIALAPITAVLNRQRNR